MASLGIEISIFLFAAFIGYILAIRIGQSAVVGMLLIGIVLGPSAFGIITYNESVRTLAEIGAIMLLFVIGLECDFRDVYKPRNAIIAILGVIVPFIAGYFLAVIFGYSSIRSLFVGTALTATSIAITAKVLKDMGKLDSDAGKAIMGAAVIDDVLGLIMLAITTGISKENLSFIGVISLILIALFFFASVVVFIPLVTRILKNVHRWSQSIGHPQLTLIFALGIAFAYSAVAEFIGLSAIVGAFIAGVTLENLDLKGYREGAEYIEMVFSAIFFVSLGLLVDLKLVRTDILVFLVCLTVVAILTKVVGCYLPSRMLGLSKRDSLMVGVGMAPRGEVAMIVALFGLSAGIIQQTLYTTILLMSIATTLIAPILLRIVSRK